MKTSESIGNLAAAFAKFQADCPAPKKSAVNPHFRSKYSPLEEILNTIKPHMSANGLSQLQSTMTEGEQIGVKTILLHSSGEFMEFDTLWLPMGKANAQGAGSSVTYARRYALCAALGIAADEDDDGNVASEPQQQKQQRPTAVEEKASDPQRKAIFAKIAVLGKNYGADVNTVKETLLTKIGADNFDNISKQMASEAIKVLEAWEKAKAEKAGA